jgi:hypothetical protein
MVKQPSSSVVTEPVTPAAVCTSISAFDGGTSWPIRPVAVSSSSIVMFADAKVRARRSAVV